MPAKVPLSNLEQQVMQIVWERGSVTAAEIQIALAPERPLKESTIRTVLVRLEHKKYLRHKRRGRAFLYTSTEQPRSIAVRAVKQILDRFCHGSLESLLVGMVDNRVVDAEELRRIGEQLAQENKKE
jgi:predicted transcriptional regulator